MHLKLNRQRRLFLSITTLLALMGHTLSVQGAAMPDKLASSWQQAGTVRISDIKGLAYLSPLNNKVVNNVVGIVTGLTATGFYMQDPDSGSNGQFDGIFVPTTNGPPSAQGVTLSDLVSVTGTVVEARPGGNNSDYLPTTQIIPQSVSRMQPGNPLPQAMVLGKGGRVPPASVINTCGSMNLEACNKLDIANSTSDFFQSLEGMRVQVKNAVVVGPADANGEITVIADDGTNTYARSARGGLMLTPTSYNPQRIVLSSEVYKRLYQAEKLPGLNVGDKIIYPIIGVLMYDAGYYKLAPVSHPLKVTAGDLQQAVTNAPTSPDQLTIATFNVADLLGTDTRFKGFAALIVKNLQAPDILALEEVGSNTGVANAIDASQTYAKLIAAIKAAGGPAYEFRQIDPANGGDEAKPAGSLRQAFLYNPARVSFVDHPGAGATTAVSAVKTNGQAHLSVSPGRIDPTNAAWNQQRKALAGEFTFQGHTVFVINSVFIPKDNDQPLFGKFQPPALSSEAQRLQQAQSVNNFVNSLLTIDPAANVAVVGNLNDFEFSRSVKTVRGNLLDDLSEKLPANQRYSYIDHGNSELLDQMLVSHSLSQVADYDIVHVNAEFAAQLSDHDPVLGRFTLPK